MRGKPRSECFAQVMAEHFREKAKARIGKTRSAKKRARKAAGYVFPERIVLDPESFDKLSKEIENPSPPTGALRRLFSRLPLLRAR